MNKGRKISGGLYHSNRKTKLYERPGIKKVAVLGEARRKNIRVMGGNIKTLSLKANQVNISVDGKAKNAQIINVAETPQNKFFARENRLSKGAIIETSLGKARITNRPTQEGCVNAVLVKE
jgi:small subunit ribosomal protein S8e